MVSYGYAAPPSKKKKTKKQQQQQQQQHLIDIWDEHWGFQTETIEHHINTFSSLLLVDGGGDGFFQGWFQMGWKMQDDEAENGIISYHILCSLW